MTIKTACWSILLCALVGCPGGDSLPRVARYAAVSAPGPGRPECPHDWDFKQGQLPVVGPAINVPEFHDCQRFVVYQDTVPRYDALYAIFAAFNQQAVYDKYRSADTLTVAAAEVYAEGVYDSLGISSTFDCLYVRRTITRSDTSWTAKMVPVGDALADCARINSDTAHGKVLEVRRTRLPGFTNRDYPAVARWGWDPAHKQQLIEIGCGDGWCEIGPRGFTPEQRPAPLPVGAAPKLRRTRSISIWYDQQYLAALSPSGRPVPSGILGRIYPDSALDDHSNVGEFANRWVPVAHVELLVPPGVVNPYKKRLNLDPTPSPNSLNTIFLCHGTQAHCDVPSSPTLVCDGDGQWWAKIIAVDLSVAFRCVTRRPHENLAFHVAGTARWRWLASDEGTWDACVQGCCEIQGEM